MKKIGGLCAIEGCGKPFYGRGLCHAHYERQRRTGDLAADRPLRRRTANGAPEQFLAEALRHKGDACLLWPYGNDGDGYGVVGHRKTHVRICEIVHGPKPPDKTEVAHNCGQRACINPRHLRWATSKENSDDMLAHGTRATFQGERMWKARLTEQQVRAIRSQTWRSQTELAMEYGVHPGTIWCVLKGKTWRHVT